MQKILNFIDGKKTYIGFVVGFVYLCLIQFAGVPSEEIVWGFITAWTGISFRDALNKY